MQLITSKAQIHARVCLTSKPAQQNSPFYLADISFSLRPRLTTLMEPSLIPPDRVIHILPYTTKAPAGPSPISPEGFPKRVESDMGLK